jgi:hypothetical protein
MDNEFRKRSENPQPIKKSSSMSPEAKKMDKEYDSLASVMGVDPREAQRLSDIMKDETNEEQLYEIEFEKEETYEGNAFTGALSKAKKHHKDEFEVDGKKYSVKECYDGSMSPMSGATQEESNLSVSTNMGTNSPLNVSVTATGGAARELMQMLRLAGLGSSDEMSDTTEPEVVIGAQEMEEDYANAPDEKYSTVNKQMNPGNDLNRPKGTYPKVAGGDNPMAMREADELAALEKQLFEELSAIKIIKK